MPDGEEGSIIRNTVEPDWKSIVHGKADRRAVSGKLCIEQPRKGPDQVDVATAQMENRLMRLDPSR